MLFRSRHTDQYIEASHIQSEMLCHLDQHLRSRPGETGSSDSVEAEHMCSARAERMHSTENEGPGVNPADGVSIPERTTHRFTTQEGIDAYRAQAQSRPTSVQSRCTDGPSVPWLDQAIAESESDSLSRTI